MSKGFLYVLANSSMPGLVKVGKTIKSPDGRASELSKVTGLPTPFIVVYEQFFQDCDEAEIFVHTILTKQGFRVADNREFFSAPVSEVIKAILKTPGAINGSNENQNDVDDYDDDCDDEDMELLESEDDDELDDLNLPEPKAEHPWTDLWEQAEDSYYGLGDNIKDYGEALKLYRQAAKLGCIMAYRRIGEMYADGEGVPANDSKALDWYKQGVRHGNYFCYVDMALLFLDADDLENFKKCLQLHFKARKIQFNPMLEDYRGVGDCYFWLMYQIFGSSFNPNELRLELLPDKNAILVYGQRIMEIYAKDNNKNGVRYAQQVLDWLNSKE